jgi:aminobenzoyl-glutamate transport protein
MIVSTVVITLVGTFVTVKVVEPRLGPWKSEETTDEGLNNLSEAERKGLFWTMAYLVIFISALIFMTVPENAVFRNETGELKPFFESIVPLILVFFLGAGLVFGYKAGTIKSDRDVSRMMAETMSGMGPYIVLSFICAQFVAFFSWSNIGMVVAIKGAGFLKTIGLSGFPLLFSFILVTAFLNLFMGSASAKWAIMAPVFIPMFMMLGYSPEIVQNSYRIGDSVTNIISPLLPYFPIIVAFARKYKPDLGVGTLVSLMLPYSLSFLISWALLFAVWFFAGWPIGPGAPLSYTAPAVQVAPALK